MDGLDASTHNFLPWRCRYRHDDGRVETVWWHRSDQLAAMSQGWYLHAWTDDNDQISEYTLFDCGTRGFPIRNTIMTGPGVLRKAIDGSDLHRRAMAFVEVTSPDWYERFLKALFEPGE